MPGENAGGRSCVLMPEHEGRCSNGQFQWNRPAVNLDSIRQYAELANITLAPDVRDNNLTLLLEDPMSMAKLNAAIGLGSESGEVLELVKKRFFHGHEWTPQTQEHLKKELGDSAWYWVLCCWAHDIDPAEVLAMNIAKLKARYPEGFSTERSVNRAPGDL